MPDDAWCAVAELAASQHGAFTRRQAAAIPAARLGLEAHRRRFHFGPEYKPLDEQRDFAVAACGWELLYLGWYSTQRAATVLEVVKRVVHTRLAMLGPEV